jgi:hypothetical protein
LLGRCREEIEKEKRKAREVKERAQREKVEKEKEMERLMQEKTKKMH